MECARLPIGLLAGRVGKVMAVVGDLLCDTLDIPLEDIKRIK